ncbi:hypothetical protein V3C99_014625 [Haemonchus contortus]|uniref:SHSP domain-containing protein n=1 Tax=Haemonchus contortus TaxID=6289 RepID=A0A7I4YUJ8_HAECO
MSSICRMSQIMDRIMEEYLREMLKNSNRNIAPYWRDADHSALRIANDAQNVVDDDKKFAVTLDVSQFKPEELTVNLEGRRLTVEGKQEQKNDNSFMSTTFIRSWTLPEDVDLEGVKSELDDKGKLTIEGALVAPVAIVGVEVTID